jgi:hypothetical protein
VRSGAIDAEGNLPANCGEPAAFAHAAAGQAAHSARLLDAPSDTAPRRTAVSMFAYHGGEPTAIEAGGDGWISITPLLSVSAPEPFPTTHLLASATDALRWVARVRARLGSPADSVTLDDLHRYVPRLGQGTVHLEVGIADTGRSKGVSFTFVDCSGLHRHYHVDRRALLEIADDVERAARISRRASPTALRPSLEHPYHIDEVSCRALPSSNNAELRFPDGTAAGERRLTHVGVRFIVDTLGRVEPGTVTVLPGVTPRLASATRDQLLTWKFRPAERGGVRVRQLLNGILPYVPDSLATSSVARDSMRPARIPVSPVLGRYYGATHYPYRVVAPDGVLTRRALVLASVVVDANGVPDATTLVTMPGTDPRAVATLRAAVAQHRFQPTRIGKRPVQERTTQIWLVEPPAACLAEDAGPECPIDDRLLAGETRPPVPASLLRPSIFYNLRAEVDPLDESADLPEPLGLPNLKEHALPRGSRELRIYTGLVIGYPHSALIVRETRGPRPTVTGRLVQYWPVNDTAFDRGHDSEALYADAVAGRCDEPRRGRKAIACAVRFTREPDWRALLRTLDSLNAWNLLDASKVPSRGMMLDGWAIRVEARRDTSYRQYRYQNPQVYRPPEGPAATMMMRIVDSLYRFAKPPRNLHYVRGIYLVGRDTSDFVRCGRPEKPGLMQGQLGPIARFLGDSGVKHPPTPARALEIEAWVRRRPESDNRVDSRYYPRVWQADSVTAVRDSPMRRCRS